MRRTPLITSILLLILAAPGANASSEILGLDAYLGQVKRQHEAVQSALLFRNGSEMHAEDGWVALGPTLFGNARLSRSDKPDFTTGLLSNVSNTYSLGVSQTTTFGLTGRLYYNLNYISYTLSPQSPIPPGSYHDAQPVIELTQSLWRNGFGSETRAQLELNEAGALATSFSSSYQARLILSQAESAYWNLAVAREAVRIGQDVLDRAEKLNDWNESRAKLQLADRSDVLQSEALLKLRRLDLASAQDNERIASHTFNSLRGEDSDRVDTAIERLGSEQKIRVIAPVRAAIREDVKAAQQQERAAWAQSQLGREKNTPTFEVFGSYARNGVSPSLGTTVSDSFGGSEPSAAVGVRMLIPLDLGLTSQSRKGYILEQQGAEKALARKFFDQDADWDDLTRRLDEGKRRLDLAIQLEKVQEEKLNQERARLKRGRTTTFQVIQFEQDYLQSRLATIRVQADILSIIAQMKTYGGPL